MANKAGQPLSIIAGGGSVPLYVARTARAAGRDVFIIGIDGEVDPGIAEFPHAILKWGEIGRLESLLASHGARELVLIGSIRSRPDFSQLKLDFGAVRILPELLRLVAGGDNDLLSGVVRMFDKRGYTIVGAHEVASELVAKPGPLGERTPDKAGRIDAERAMVAARAIGPIDAGQAAVAVNGRVVALEAAEGTDAVLERVAALRASGRIRWNGRAGVLAKCAKPQQDLRVDMPTIGPKTVAAAIAAGLAGIVVEAGRVMIVDRADVLREADAGGLFLVGQSLADETRP